MVATQEDIKRVKQFLSHFKKFKTIRIPSQEDINSSKEWWEGAEQEFKAMESLQKAELYPQSINHLVLCIEKLVKAYGILNNAVNRDRVKSEIGHVSPRIFIKMLENTQVHSFLKLYLKDYSRTNPDQSIAKLQLMFGKKVNIKTEEELARMPKETMLNIFTVVDKVSEVMKKNLLNKTVENAFTEKGSNLILRTSIRRYLIDQKVWNKIKKLRIDEVYREPLLNMYLFLLAVISFPHHNASRYINAFGRKINYNNSLGIISNIDIIKKRLVYCKDIIRKDIENSKEDSEKNEKNS